ncbi:hypothetical protein COOONC_05807 [Cooperia oncophora]
MDAVMRKTFNGRQGVQYGEGGFLTDLMFADDSAIFAETDEEATNIMCSLSEIAQSYGLKINAEKTKVMTSDGSPASVRLGSVALEQVSNFKYLGSVVQERKVAAEAEVRSRIGHRVICSVKWRSPVTSSLEEEYT